MGQFDSATDAALAQLNFEEISKTPGGEFAEIIGALLAFTGVAGPAALASGASNLLLKIRSLAGASYASNLIFVITAVRDDLKALYEKYADLRGRIDALPTDPKFAEAIAALALRAMHTSVKDRLKRLARIVANGVKEDDLEPESLDDMLRAAVVLKDLDVLFLERICHRWDTQAPTSDLDDPFMFESMFEIWNQLGSRQKTSESACRGSLARLQAHGLLYSWYGGGYGSSTQYDLLDEGKRFYERLQEIGSSSSNPRLIPLPPVA